MRVLLLKPYVTINTEDVDTFGLYPPLGLGYLASVLERENITVKIVDCQLSDKPVRKVKGKERIRFGMSDEEIERELRSFSPQIVGISSNFTCFSDDPIEIARLTRRVCPNALLVMGGAHVTMAYNEILEKGDADIVVRGDGEITFLELVKRIREKQPYDSIEGIALRNSNSEVLANKPGSPIMNLDDLPFPAYHLFQMDRYINQRDKNFAFYLNYPFGFVMSSRGCPYNCIFCSTSKFFKRYRTRSPGSVVDEIELLSKNYGIKEIHYLDDSFNADKKRAASICREIIDRRLNISWQVGQGINIENVDKALLQIMVKSGLYRIGFSIESGSEDTLRYVRKKLDLPHARRVIIECNKLGIYTFGNFIIGFPYETRAEINKTISFIMNSNLDFINLLICQPLAGADLYDSFKEAGLFDGSPKHGSHYMHTLYNTKHLEAEELNKLRRATVKKFLIRRMVRLLTPGGFLFGLLPKINSVKKIRYAIKVGYNIGKMIALGKNIA